MLFAVVGEFTDALRFASHDAGEIETGGLNLQSPGIGKTGEMQDFGGVEQGLARHAAAQDAQPANLVAAFDDNCFQPRTCCRPGRRVTGAAAAYDCHIEIEFRSLAIHTRRMKQPKMGNKALRAS